MCAVGTLLPYPLLASGVANASLRGAFLQARPHAGAYGHGIDPRMRRTDREGVAMDVAGRRSGRVGGDMLVR